MHYKVRLGISTKKRFANDSAVGHWHSSCIGVVASSVEEAKSKAVELKTKELNESKTNDLISIEACDAIEAPLPPCSKCGGPNTVCSLSSGVYDEFISSEGMDKSSQATFALRCIDCKYEEKKFSSSGINSSIVICPFCGKSHYWH